VQLVYMNC